MTDTAPAECDEFDDYDDYYDEDEPCDHEYYDVDLLAGLACCYRCGEAWWLSDEQLRREIELAAQMWLEPNTEEEARHD